MTAANSSSRSRTCSGINFPPVAWAVGSLPLDRRINSASDRLEWRST
jgi:hypothetical protein